MESIEYSRVKSKPIMGPFLSMSKLLYLIVIMALVVNVATLVNTLNMTMLFQEAREGKIL
jgi:hypothetical protein